MCDSSTKMYDRAWEKDLSTNAVSLSSKEDETSGQADSVHCFQTLIFIIQWRKSMGQFRGEMILEHWILCLSPKLWVSFCKSLSFIGFPRVDAFHLFSFHEVFVGDSKPSHHPNSHFLNDFSTLQSSFVFSRLPFLTIECRSFFLDHFSLTLSALHCHCGESLYHCYALCYQIR